MKFSKQANFVLHGGGWMVVVVGANKSKKKLHCPVGSFQAINNSDKVLLLPLKDFVVNKKLFPSDVNVNKDAQPVKHTMPLLFAMDNLEPSLEKSDLVNLRMIHSTLYFINMNCTDLIYIVSHLS